LGRKSAIAFWGWGNRYFVIKFAAIASYSKFRVLGKLANQQAKGSAI
jgi:hypothetical protein